MKNPLLGSDIPNKKLHSDLVNCLKKATISYKDNKNKSDVDLESFKFDFTEEVTEVICVYCENNGLHINLRGLLNALNAGDKKILNKYNANNSSLSPKETAAKNVLDRWYELNSTIEKIAQEVFTSLQRHDIGENKKNASVLKIIGCLALFFGACKVFMENIVPNIKLAFSNEPGKTVAIIALGLAAGALALKQVVQIMSEGADDKNLAKESKIITTHLTEEIASKYEEIAKSLDDYAKTYAPGYRNDKNVGKGVK